jgi:hypothetical protein
LINRDLPYGAVILDLPDRRRSVAKNDVALASVTVTASRSFHRSSVNKRGGSAAFFVQAHNPKLGKAFVVVITLKMHLDVELDGLRSVGKHNVKKLSVEPAFVRTHLKDIAAVAVK